MCVVVQFYHWFKFYFLLFQNHYHTLPYPKTNENKIYSKDKIEPQHIHPIREGELILFFGHSCREGDEGNEVVMF